MDAWIDGQNAYSAARIAALPDYARIRARLEELWTTERMTLPSVHDGRYFFEYNDGQATLAKLMEPGHHLPLPAGRRRGGALPPEVHGARHQHPGDANLRGGGEYGADWHLAGTRERKQNVFDDFIAAAEWLIAERWTSPEKLAIYGRSNGGLLVGAVQLQRPELFAAAGPAVGVLDMLRYHTPSANARTWAGDYGLSENEADFRAQLAYSPVHNVRAGTCYPATIIHTGKFDDRVVPFAELYAFFASALGM